MQKRGQLIILSGPSGVGKGTIRREVFKDKSLNLVFSISMTTRPKRSNEVEGKDYFFVDRATFEKAIKNDEFLECAEFVGHYYGTPKKWVDELLNQGKNVMLEIEVEGAKQVMMQCPEAITIFLVPPSLKVLEKRIRARRSEAEEIVELRLKKAEYELELQNYYEHVIVNDNVEDATNNMIKVLKKHL